MTIMKHILQLVDHKSGIRSEPFHCTMDELKAELSLQNAAGNAELEDYLLLVATEYEESGEIQFMIPKSPLVKVGSFLKMDDQEQASNA